DHPSRDSLFADDGIDLQGKRAKAITQNLPFLLDWAQADGLMVPTHYQARGLPPKIRRDAWVVHDGVDTDFFSPGGDGVLDFLPNPIPADAPVVTYATRGMEPHRGFPQFMQAISALQKTHLDVHVIIAGRDRVYYGRDDLPDGQTWKTKMLADYEYDRARLHFTGPLPYGQYRDVLRRSHAHVYLTVPFVLSWSLIEAMATACPIITNDCPPTKEALPDESSAQFVNFLDVRSVLDGITHMLDHPTQAHAKGAAARDIALHQYTQSDIFPQKYAYIRSIATAPL
ncbi:MAG: glycosyltransferase, partial [Pseudomonadota bacterium]